jgi:hypothetical protein
MNRTIFRPANRKLRKPITPHERRKSFAKWNLPSPLLESWTSKAHRKATENKKAFPGPAQLASKAISFRPLSILGRTVNAFRGKYRSNIPCRDAQGNRIADVIAVRPKRHDITTTKHSFDKRTIYTQHGDALLNMNRNRALERKLRREQAQENIKQNKKLIQT